MPLKQYGVLVGSAIDRRLGSGSNPHYQVHLVDHITDYRIAVNVQSQDGSEVEYVVDSHFSHPLLDALRELPLGFHPLASHANQNALDYIRGNLVDRTQFVPLPLSLPGPDNDLNEKVDQYVLRAMSDQAARVFAFGERWPTEPTVKDKIFGFLPGNGIHDIHMNQGNDPDHVRDDGVWQDGGLLFNFPATDQWVAVFLRFQSQAWHTDDETGHALDSTPSRQDGIIRIVAALVNATGSPERETVSLLNTTPLPQDLSGWALLDKAEQKTPLNGELAAGVTRVFQVTSPMALSNQGGLISLVDAAGLKVDGVSYTKAQASKAGWTIKF
jgi:uncharacterized protein YukJ